MNANFPELITSFKNPKIQYIRELLSSRKCREENHACVLEGVRLAEEALQAEFIPQIAVFSDGLSSRGMELVGSLQGKPTQILKVPDYLAAARRYFAEALEFTTAPSLPPPQY